LVRLNKKTEHQVGLSRTQTVWLAFAASMTLFGGLFVLTGPNRGAGLDPLMALGGESAAAGRPASAVSADGRAWATIIVHHSGLHFDDHLQIDRRHRESGLNGSGFHFIIGNGLGRLGDGEIVSTARWLSQSPGAHVAITDDADAERVDRLNLESIGIALIGDGNDRAPTAAQMRSLETLVLELQRDHAVQDDRVKLHSEVSEVSSPGRFFPRVEFSQFLATER
jgi:N-acetyl-anhydromuramyl-L-alanine amidase AmpD